MTDTPLHDDVSARPAAKAGSVLTTMGVTVRTLPRYVAEESDVQVRRFVFAYDIRITNERDEPVQLLTRHWSIVDADGSAHVVDGDGVVGQQPVIQPGNSFEYSSWCPLTTAWGTMEGRYTLRSKDAGEFSVGIGRFFLVAGE